jgi:hypothetical protein
MCASFWQAQQVSTRIYITRRVLITLQFFQPCHSDCRTEAAHSDSGSALWAASGSGSGGNRGDTSGLAVFSNQPGRRPWPAWGRHQAEEIRTKEQVRTWYLWRQSMYDCTEYIHMLDVTGSEEGYKVTSKYIDCLELWGDLATDDE